MFDGLVARSSAFIVLFEGGGNDLLPDEVERLVALRGIGDRLEPHFHARHVGREARFVHVEGETLRTACEFEPGFRVRKRFAFGVGHGRGAVKMQVGTLQVSVFDAVIGCGVTDFGFAVVVVAGSESCGGEEEEEDFFHVLVLLDVYIQSDAEGAGASALDELVADRLEIEDVVTRSPEVAAPDVERIVLVLEPHGGVC